MKQYFNSKAFIDAIVPEQNIKFITSQALFDKGICTCTDCGAACSVDYKFCSKCQKTVVVVIAKLKRK